jgi:ParB family chromosome partitioning protein
MSNQLLVEYKNIDEIKPYGRNSRKNDLTVGVVVESIKNYGFQQPIVINKDNIIVAGHSRYKAAKILKMDRVPTVLFDKDKTSEKEYRILDNRVAENSEWDIDLLKTELKDLDLPTGFTSVELEKLLGDEQVTELAEPTVFECIIDLESEAEQLKCFNFVKEELKAECRILSI